jgi:hypothetical protein
MKWVLVIFTIWSTDGVPEIDIKHSEIYYPSRHTCEFAMAEFAERYEPYTQQGFGYVATCMHRDEWERRQHEVR